MGQTDKQRPAGTHAGAGVPGENPNFAEVGRILRRTREERGMSLEDAEKRTRVRISYLRAMEEGNMNALPGPTFVVGFLRLYARCLDLPDQDLVEKVNAQVNSELDGLRFSAPSSPRFRPRLSLVVAGLLLFGGIFFLSEYILKQMENRVEEVPAAVQQPATGNSKITSETPSRIPVDEEPAMILEEKNVKEPPVPPDNPPPEEVVSDPPEAAPPADPQPVTTPVVETAVPVVNFEATTDVWIQIFDKNKKKLKETTMKPGDRFDLPEDARFADVGNPSGLKVRVGGREIKPLGAPGQVLRNVDVSPKTLSAL